MNTVRDVHVLSMPMHVSTIGGRPAGNLVSVDISKDLPFIPARIFYVSSVSERHDRGRHAHRETVQIISCINGSVGLTLRDGQGGVVTFNLKSPNTAIYVPNMIWDEVDYEDSNSTLLVFSNTPFNSEDYLKDWTSYINEYNKTS